MALGYSHNPSACCAWDEAAFAIVTVSGEWLKVNGAAADVGITTGLCSPEAVRVPSSGSAAKELLAVSRLTACGDAFAGAPTGAAASVVCPQAVRAKVATAATANAVVLWFLMLEV